MIIAPTAIVSQDAVFSGRKTVTIGSGMSCPFKVHTEGLIDSMSKGSIIHPSAQILANNGDIVIGENCIIEERVVIQNKWALSSRVSINTVSHMIS